MSGLITSRTTSNIQLVDATCRGTLNVLIKNIGTTSLSSTPTFVVKGTTLAGGAITCNPAFPLSAGSSSMCANNTPIGVPLGSGPNEIRVIGPSNAVGGTVNCP
jgi:hypothetical protein